MVTRSCGKILKQCRYMYVKTSENEKKLLKLVSCGLTKRQIPRRDYVCTAFARTRGYVCDSDASSSTYCRPVLRRSTTAGRGDDQFRGLIPQTGYRPAYLGHKEKPVLTAVLTRIVFPFWAVWYQNGTDLETTYYRSSPSRIFSDFFLAAGERKRKRIRPWSWQRNHNVGPR